MLLKNSNINKIKTENEEEIMLQAMLAKKAIDIILKKVMDKQYRSKVDTLKN